MKNGFQKYIAFFCAVLVIALAAGIGSSFAVRVLAAQTQRETARQTSGAVTQVSTESGRKSSSAADGASGAGSDGSQAGSRAPESGAGSSPESTSGTPGGPSAESDLITVTFNLNGGTGMKTTARLEKGTSVSQLRTPTRTGYQFTGWSRGGMILPASKILNSDTALTANWKKAQNGAASSGGASVDTRQDQIDAAASAAKEAISEPGVLSSEDWNSILSASSGVSSAGASSQSVSSAAASSGGFSTLLVAGIALILLGVAGVVVFIYLQFIRKKPPRGGPRGGSGGGRRGSDDDTLTFTDISSYSNGKKPDDAASVLYPQSGGQRAPRPPASDRKEREARMQRSRAQAVKAAGRDRTGKGDFDWEKFFDSEDE